MELVKNKEEARSLSSDEIFRRLMSLYACKLMMNGQLILRGGGSQKMGKESVAL